MNGIYQLKPPPRQEAGAPAVRFLAAQGMHSTIS
jgi:hypothetical protein